MSKSMFILRPTEKKYKVVCPDCTKRGEVIDSCKCCHGAGVRSKRVRQYYVQEKPVEIVKVDRDPKTGVLRYWEDSSNYYYETTTPELNHFVPEVPYGVHLCHDTSRFATAECNRINEYLSDVSKQTYDVETSSVGFNF